MLTDGAAEGHPYRTPPRETLGALVRELHGAAGPSSSQSARALGSLVMAIPLFTGLYYESFLAGLATAGVLVGIVALRSMIRARRLCAELHEGGVVLMERRKRRTVLWEDAAILWRDEIVELGGRTKSGERTKLGESRTYWLKLRSGETVGFDDRIKGVKEMADRVQVEMVKRLLPPLRETVAAGGTARFGVITVGHAGLSSHDQKPVPWERIDRVTLISGRLRVLLRGQSAPWISLPVSELPNVALLWELLDDLAPSVKAPAPFDFLGSLEQGLNAILNPRRPPSTSGASAPTGADGGEHEESPR